MSDGLTLAPDQKAAFRRLMEYDPWIFSIVVCGRDPRAERHHRPLLYLYTRRADLLCALLDDPAYAGPITDQIKADFERNGLNWNDPRHLDKIRHRLRRVNVRMPRSSGKSTFADDGDLWDATVDPNITISIGSKADPYAWDRISTIGKFVLSPSYAYWFPDRVPANPRQDVTQDAITLNGRTRHVPEATIEGRGLTSQWAGRHYRKNRRDDIVGTESGEASLEDALKHMANLSALRDHTGWVGDVMIGTINGEEDDHTMLAADEGVLSIVVPMEEHDGGTTLENIYEDGTLCMPEWFDRDTVNQIKSEARSNPKYGAIWLLQNFYMSAHKTGTSIIGAALLERCKFEWFFSPSLNREIIRRPKKGFEKIPRKNLQPKDWFYLDPLNAIPATAKATAVDQSVSEDGTADFWAQVYVCQDWEGHYYVLDALRDHGYANLLGELIPFDSDKERKEIRSEAGQPAYIGIDSNATQSMTATWLKGSDDFRAIGRRVQEVRASNERKDINIRNYVIARMLTGELWINPRLHSWFDEALKYRPYKQDGTRRRKPKDDQLDATWMAMSLVRLPPSPEVIEEDEMEAAMNLVARRGGVMRDSWFNRAPHWRVA